MSGYKTNQTGDLDDYFFQHHEILDINTVNNTLWVWGYNNNGQLGINSYATISSPIQTLASGNVWKNVKSIQNAIYGIKTDNTLWAWGANERGQLGVNDLISRSSPIQISTDTSWKKLTVGRGYYIASIKSDGSLWCWGQNQDGQLGDNSVVLRSTPIQTISGGFDWNNVSCGYNHTGAIKTDHSLWMWGSNSHGMLGTNDTISCSSPVQTVTGGYDWKQVSCSWSYTAAIKTDGTLWSWGDNSNYQLGDSTAILRSSPVQTSTGGTNWKVAVTGNGYTAGIKTDNTLWMWGKNSSGQLGTNSVITKVSPVQTVAGGTNWKTVELANAHTLAVKLDGTLWAWGSNQYGQVGDNTVQNCSSPIQNLTSSDWLLISAGLNHSLAVKG